MAAVSYLEVEELRSHDVMSPVRTKRMFSFFFQVQTQPRVCGASEGLLCKHQICWLAANSNTKATMKVEPQPGKSQKTTTIQENISGKPLAR